MLQDGISAIVIVIIVVKKVIITYWAGIAQKEGFKADAV